ncbi:nucleoside triphosphate pyrophosphohydrolase [Halobacteria archaeon AArc-m2/3/4]|uniref:Nucleoside triphosphate pyrophosphohydrolase n=1 Tax=Natronoglomus mannanivorans TaxID=2979990 RepID=A0ABT2QBA0_9EURY|nr:nucleoside triphosphate pyrophosphohydrolase [Halobacteria archaeon AArc-m2/3/4]
MPTSTTYDKLVRDRIPEIIDANDERPVTHVADDTEYERRLREKLLEEATEFEESGDLEELADVLEVIDAMLAFEGGSRAELDELRREKREDRGGFEERIVLEQVEQAE